MLSSADCPCQEILDTLAEYLDGRLSPMQVRVFESHLAECGPCRRYLDAYRRTVELGRAALEADSAAPPPPELIRALKAALRTRRP